MRWVQIGNRIRRTFVRWFTATQGASVVGRVIPFGVGAVIGGVGNHLLGRKVIASSRTAFGPPPVTFPLVLGPTNLPPEAARNTHPAASRRTYRRRQIRLLSHESAPCEIAA